VPKAALKISEENPAWFARLTASPTVRYLALLVVVVVLFFWKTLLTKQYTLIIGSEGVNQTYAWLHFWVDSIRHFRLPLWDPYEFAGSPFAGSLLPSAYYPLQLLFAIAPLTRDGFISPGFYHIYLALTHLLCAFFMFALLRELRCSHFAAFIGACVFPLSGLLTRMIWPGYIEACIWLPAIFFFLLRALRTERRDRSLLEAAFCGFCLAMAILTGGMAFFIMQVICVVTAGIWYAMKSAPEAAASIRAHWIRMGQLLSVSLAVAIGLSAVQLLPASEYGKQTLRFIDGGTFPSADKIPYDRLVPGVWPQSIISALFPVAFDGRFGGEEYFPFYVGILPLCLAVIAIWKCRESVWVKYLAGLALLCFVYAMGALSPLHGVLYAITPLLWVTRAANRFFYPISFSLAILAAFGLDVLIDPLHPRSRWEPAKPFLKWIAIAAAAAFFLPALYAQITLNLWNAFSLLLILGACGLLAYLFANPARPSIRLVLTLFILFDLSAFNWLEFDKAVLHKNGDQLEQMVSLRGAAMYVKSRPGLERVRVAVQPEPNVGDIYGIQSVWGGSPTILTAYSKLGSRDDLFNVGYYIKPAATTDPNPEYKDAAWKVYRNPHAFPRGWIVHSAVTVPTQDAAFSRLDAPGLDLHQTAILETPASVALAPSNTAVEALRFLSYEPERMEIDVTAANSGMLVLSEMYYPGWIAKVNGKAAKIYRVDGAFRGIPVSAGGNRIVVEYASNTFRVGAAVSLLTMACFLAGWYLVWKRSRHG